MIFQVWGYKKGKNSKDMKAGLQIADFQNKAQIVCSYFLSIYRKDHNI